MIKTCYFDFKSCPCLPISLKNAYLHLTPPSNSNNVSFV
nr:MAG TPA: hypothetical protein [Caudoviricetes sp.]DAY85753.1 MAG TPA: hypothetical protein [Caudoviricetes sp.]